MKAPRRLSEKERSELVKTYANGAHLADVAKTFDVAIETARRIACAAGIRKGPGCPRRCALDESAFEAEGQKLPSQVGCALTGLADGLDVGAQRIHRLQILQEDFAGTEDHRQKVV